MSYEKVGNVLVAQGKLDAEWRHDVAVGRAKLAAVYLKRGDTAAALSELREGRDIMAQLVAVAPAAAQWKKTLAWFEKMIALLEAGTHRRIDHLKSSGNVRWWPQRRKSNGPFGSIPAVRLGAGHE